jgi:transposase
MGLQPGGAMPRFKPYSYDQAKLIAVDLGSQLQPGTFEFAVNRLIDELDLSVFDARFQNEETEAPAYDPAILLKMSAAGVEDGGRQAGGLRASAEPSHR